MKKVEATKEEVDIVKKFNEEHPEVIEIARLLGQDLKNDGQLIAAIERAKIIGRSEPKECDKVVFPLLKRIADKDEGYFKGIFNGFYGRYLIGAAVALKHDETVFKVKEELETDEILLLYIPNFVFIYEGLYSETINFLSWPLVYSNEWQPNRKKPVRDYDDFRDKVSLNNKIEILKKHFKSIDRNHSIYLADKWRFIRNSIAHLKFKYSKTFIDLEEYGRRISLNAFEDEVKRLLTVSVDLGSSIATFKTSPPILGRLDLTEDY